MKKWFIWFSGIQGNPSAKQATRNLKPAMCMNMLFHKDHSIPQLKYCVEMVCTRCQNFESFPNAFWPHYGEFTPGLFSMSTVGDTVVQRHWHSFHCHSVEIILKSIMYGYCGVFTLELYMYVWISLCDTVPQITGGEKCEHDRCFFGIVTVCNTVFPAGFIYSFLVGYDAGQL